MQGPFKIQAPLTMALFIILWTSFPPSHLIAQPAGLAFPNVPIIERSNNWLGAFPQASPINDSGIPSLPNVTQPNSSPHPLGSALNPPYLILTQAEPAIAPSSVGISPPPPAFTAPPSGTLPPGFNPNQPITQQGGGSSFWTQASDQLGFTSGSTSRRWFQSDHAFDGMISPMSNPFFFEDPRALTEIRPVVLYQSMPGSSNPVSGNLWWYGTQMRLAITEKLSVTIHKLGGIGAQADVNSGSIDTTENKSSFSEFWISPKWTFYRNERSGTVAAAGVQLQMDTGSSLFQGTGGLGIAPYAVVGQSFGRSSYGSFNGMGLLAYSAGTTSDRSSFVNFGAHVDYDVANWHKFYPFLELNWFSITSGGSTLPNVKIEGADLINFGSGPSNGMNQINIAPGVRYKFSESLQTGIAFEFPLTSVDNTIENFRLNLDFIFRY